MSNTSKTNRQPKHNSTGVKIPSAKHSPVTRSYGTMLAWGVVGLVVLVIVVLVVVKMTRSTTPVPRGVTYASPTTLHAVTHVPVSVLEAAGLGNTPVVTPPKVIKNTPLLTKSGLPRIVYIGADYCPYCAAQRWAFIVALSQFGSFSKLVDMTSSTSDVFGGTSTFSFYGSVYSSPYITFTPVETNTNTQVNGSYPTLQTPTKTENDLITKYDAPPYVSSASSGGIPFIDIANKFVMSGAQYTPGALSGMSRGTIAGSLSLPTTPPGSYIDASANWLIAAICTVTSNTPAKVCSRPVIKAAEKRL